MMGLFEAPAVNRIFLFGCGAHARKLYHYIAASEIRFGGFLSEITSEIPPVAGQKVLPFDQLRTPEAGDAVVIAIGNPLIRRRLGQACEDRGWRLGTICHRTAYCAPDAQIGAGSVVCAGAIIETGVKIGRGVIVDVGAVIDHDTHVADFIHIRAGQVCSPTSNH
jgi:hypothetical protein